MEDAPSPSAQAGADASCPQVESIEEPCSQDRGSWRNLMTTDSTRRDEASPGSQSDPRSLSFGPHIFQGEAIQEQTFTDRLEGNQIVKSAKAVVVPSTDDRWDYHAGTELQGPKGLIHKGVCIKADYQQDGSLEFSFQGMHWDLERASVKNIEIFGMSNPEIAHWFPQLTGLVRGVRVPGLTLNTELRPFLYAVPLKGLTARGNIKSFFVRDFGITSCEDDVFNPILAGSKISKMVPVWKADVPKAWGVVFARDFVQAEQIALNRAQFTADLISFALGTGMSHLDTRFESIPLEWDVEVGRSNVTLTPWILILEQENIKGWIRTVPLVDRNIEIDLEDGLERISFFSEHFLDASESGDFLDQTSQRMFSKRERRLSAGIQRSLRWLRIGLNESTIGDQFIAAWIALEAILNAIDYPGVFDGARESLGDLVKKSVNALDLPREAHGPLDISVGMIRNRALQNQWPLRTKVVLFARSCGVALKAGDSELVRDLSRLRNEVFHAGRNVPSVSEGQVRQLRYLIERLVVAASVYGYEDVEENCRHDLQFEEIGPEGGGAPLFLNGREVPYTFRIVGEKDGDQFEEFIIEGKIYSRRNSNISFASNR